ncbi:MAG: hypothetical protein AUJ12_05740 [Alphaproteobacteria bacterium CG1_02_46_17]|nr:MAG: hypothetical protein AUJ12_05740 [Alphaproteobacteria bacterium CG1_02_46_17]
MSDIPPSPPSLPSLGSDFLRAAQNQDRQIIFPVLFPVPEGRSPVEEIQAEAIYRQYEFYAEQIPGASLLSHIENEAAISCVVNLQDNTESFWETYEDALDLLRDNINEFWIQYDRQMQSSGPLDDPEISFEDDDLDDHERLRNEQSENHIRYYGDPERDPSAKYILDLIDVLKGITNPFDAMFEVEMYNDNGGLQGKWSVERDKYFDVNAPLGGIGFYYQRLMSGAFLPVMDSCVEPEVMAHAFVTFAVGEAIEYHQYQKKNIENAIGYTADLGDLMDYFWWLKNDGLKGLSVLQGYSDRASDRASKQIVDEAIQKMLSGSSPERK